MTTKILTIETSTKSCSVCLTKDGQPWIVRETPSQSGHAEKITLFINEVVETAGIQLSEIDAIAVSMGPGSYTGLRIGVSTAKGLCYALDKPLIAVDTLQALARGAQIQQTKEKVAYVALMDARRMDAYVGIYNSQMEPIKAPYFCTLEANSFDYLLELDEIDEVVLVGDAMAKYQEMVEHAQISCSSIDLPSSKFMAGLAQKAFEAAQFEDVAYFEPFYLKQPNITKPKPKF